MKRGLISSAFGALALALIAAAAVPAAAARGVNKPGPAVRGTGIGTQAALQGPNCDAKKGTVAFAGGSPVPCVVPFKAGANNGGATAPGVTKDSIKVVVYGPTVDEETQADLAFKPMNLATGGTGTVPDMYNDEAAVFEHAFETYGRKVEFQFVYETGTDEAAQRADAVAVAAMKPFAVLGGGPVFAQAIAADHIVSITGGTNNEMEAQQPYRESSATDVNVPMVALAELIAKDLKGKPAQWAGTDLQKKRRVFGIEYSTGAGEIDIKLFQKLLREAGIKPAVVEPFALPVDSNAISSAAQQAAPTLVAKLKAAGVTSVIPLNSSYQVTQELTNAATAQDYTPEWLVAGTAYEDVDLVGRFMDQSQWVHTFGVSAEVPSSAAATSASTNPADSTSAFMTWYYGPNKGTFNIGPLGQLQKLFYGIHMAGPKLTAANVRQGIFAIPTAQGALQGQVLNEVVAFGHQLKLPFPQYATGGDETLIWWDKDTSGTSNVVASEGKGMYRRIDDAKRYLPGQLPGNVAFFNPQDTITEFATIPASDQATLYPCKGCPSSGS